MARLRIRPESPGHASIQDGNGLYLMACVPNKTAILPGNR